MSLAILMTNLYSIVVFLIVLSILIIVHEWGHFMTAIKLGVRVESFSIGFGPKLFKKVIGGVEYCVSLFPLGGYVKMAGESREDCKGAPDEFHSKPPECRALIAINGPIVNFLLAYLCFVVVFLIGYPDFSTKVGQVMKDFPAQQAGLLVGDRIVKINKQPVTNWTEVKKSITNPAFDKLDLEITRNGKPLDLTLVPRFEEQKNVFGQKQKTRLIGIVPADELVSLKYGLGQSLVLGFTKIVEITEMTYKSIYFMITGSMSAKNVAGPVMIFKIIKEAAAMGFNHLVFIVGVISASLAIFNLLPIIPLDGGHLLLMAIEKVRGKPLPEKMDEIVGNAGFVLIICFALFVFYNDFENIGLIAKIKSLFIR
ncbi:MAG: RIP metalloprotease RseP [Candidatus Omnitrophica bacterium]|nr:RIP metalloprotease RseP [Candidatus Omnitrophota bacterium]